jgi:hypothetical protein
VEYTEISIATQVAATRRLGCRPARSPPRSTWFHRWSRSSTRDGRRIVPISNGDLDQVTGQLREAAKREDFHEKTHQDEFSNRPTTEISAKLPQALNIA